MCSVIYVGMCGVWGMYVGCVIGCLCTYVLWYVCVWCVVCVYVYGVKYVCTCGVWKVCVWGVVLGGSVGVCVCVVLHVCIWCVYGMCVCVV